MLTAYTFFYLRNVEFFLLSFIMKWKTSNALTFLWHELATHQESQERLYQEIRHVIGNKNLDVEALTNMPYLKACVKESLR